MTEQDYELEEIEQMPEAQVIQTTRQRQQVSLLESNLGSEIESDSHVKSVSKELFTNNAIFLKTEVSHDEIPNITRILFLRDRFGVQNMDTAINSFLSLRVSKDRKSRKEFIESLQSENRNAQGGGWVSKLFGQSGGPQ